MRCNQVQKKKSLIVLTLFGFLTISWVTSIGLRWFLNHFENNTLTYSSYEIAKFNSHIFLAKRLKNCHAFFAFKSWTRDWLVSDFFGHFSTYRYPSGRFLMHFVRTQILFIYYLLLFYLLAYLFNYLFICSN